MPISAASMARTRAYVDAVNARTACVQCGAQPIEWHNPEHVALGRESYRIGKLVGKTTSIEKIEAELARCTPLCRRCHMREDGRLQALVERVTQPRPAVDPKPCIECGEPWKPLRHGRCKRCYDRQWYHRKAQRGESPAASNQRASTCRTRRVREREGVTS